MFCWHVSFHVDHKFDMRIPMNNMDSSLRHDSNSVANIKISCQYSCCALHCSAYWWRMHHGTHMINEPILDCALCTVHCMSARARNAHKRIINEFSVVQWNDHEATGFHTLSFVLLTFLLRERTKRINPFEFFLKNDISKKLFSLKSRRQNENYKIQLKFQPNSIVMHNIQILAAHI